MAKGLEACNLEAPGSILLSYHAPAGFAHGSTMFKSSVTFVNSQLVSLPPVEFF